MSRSAQVYDQSRVHTLVCEPAHGQP
jgi:hypothetical protein